MGAQVVTCLELLSLPHLGTLRASAPLAAAARDQQHWWMSTAHVQAKQAGLAIANKE